MTQELTVREATTVVANAPDQLSALQAPLAGWAKLKLDEASAEHLELTQAVEEAKKHKWKTSVLTKAATAALARVTFYEKVVAALEAGYMLFPPVPNADVIAIRTDNEYPGVNYETWRRYNRPANREKETKGLPIQEGSYKSPVVHWTRYGPIKKNEKGDELQEWMPLDLENPVFPLAMAKPTIVAATNAAMEMKVFDEIRMFPFERRGKGDPCILGSIMDADTKRRLYFMISWRIDMRDI